jgi:hypothetical protein
MLEGIRRRHRFRARTPASIREVGVGGLLTVPSWLEGVHENEDESCCVLPELGPAVDVEAA